MCRKREEKALRRSFDRKTRRRKFGAAVFLRRRDGKKKGIDSFFKQQFAEILKKLKERGVTIIMVSHDVEFCAKSADLVSMFFDGSVVTTNTPNQFFSRNSFYTTAANRMSRHIFQNAVNVEDVVELCRKNR